MFWSDPKCPVDDEARDWLNWAFQWLVDELGSDVVCGVDVVLPEERFFPDRYDASRDSVRRMLERVCEYMDVDPQLVDVRFFEDPSPDRLHPLAADGRSGSHVLGEYRMKRNGKYSVRLNMGQAANPELMAATIAHELAHVILLGEGRLRDDFDGHEEMADLLTVAYGMGVFTANSSFVFEQWTNSQYQGWNARRAGYLTEQAFGYALGLFAHLRGEHKPAWAGYLRTNVRSYFKQSAKYLDKYGPGKRTGGDARVNETAAV